MRDTVPKSQEPLMPCNEMKIRPWEPRDDVVEITEMLHRAYAPLAARGLRYNATHQPPEVTRRRLSGGFAFVAEVDGRLVGTITTYRPDLQSTALVYREPFTFHFGQFGVEPDFKGKGIGRALHQAILDCAVGNGATAMALDTAAPASDLIALYRRWGYSEVGRAQWDSTNYESVIMVRALTPERNDSRDLK
jgi:GNAT superfamily N-acetyltransferase